MPCVHVVRTDRISRHVVDAGIDAILSDRKDELAGKRVVIKPNMGNLDYVSGVISRPEMIGALTGYFRDLSCEVSVVESDGIRYSCDEAFERTGIRSEVERCGGHVVNLSREATVTVPLGGLAFKEYSLPKVIHDADFFVSSPLIKTHEMTMITCGLKNQFGCIPDRHRILHHYHLNEAIVDANLARPPDLVVTDGTICMEGNGPIHGPEKRLDLMLFSDNVVANDLVAAEIMKAPVQDVVHVQLAIRRGLGPSSIEEIDMTGVPISELSDCRFQMPELDLVASMMKLAFRSPFATRLLFTTSVFQAVNSMAWKVRNLRGREKRF